MNIGSNRRINDNNDQRNRLINQANQQVDETKNIMKANIDKIVKEGDGTMDQLQDALA